MTPEETAAADAADEQAAAEQKAAAEKEAADKAAAEAAAASPAPKGKTTPARVLLDCELGKANDVVHLSAADLKSAEAGGKVDSDKAAVKYAQSLKND